MSETYLYEPQFGTHCALSAASCWSGAGSGCCKCLLICTHELELCGCLVWLLRWRSALHWPLAFGCSCVKVAFRTVTVHCLIIFGMNCPRAALCWFLPSGSSNLWQNFGWCFVTKQFTLPAFDAEGNAQFCLLFWNAQFCLLFWKSWASRTEQLPTWIGRGNSHWQLGDLHPRARIFPRGVVWITQHSIKGWRYTKGLPNDCLAQAVQKSLALHLRYWAETLKSEIYPFFPFDNTGAARSFGNRGSLLCWRSFHASHCGDHV